MSSDSGAGRPTPRWFRVSLSLFGKRFENIRLFRFFLGWECVNWICENATLGFGFGNAPNFTENLVPKTSWGTECFVCAWQVPHAIWCPRRAVYSGGFCGLPLDKAQWLFESNGSHWWFLPATGGKEHRAGKINPETVLGSIPKNCTPPWHLQVKACWSITKLRATFLPWWRRDWIQEKGSFSGELPIPFWIWRQTCAQSTGSVLPNFLNPRLEAPTCGIRLIGYRYKVRAFKKSNQSKVWVLKCLYALTF